MRRHLLFCLCLLVVVMAGEAAADGLSGRIAYRRGDYPTAFREFSAGEEIGPLELFFLGLMQLRGEGVPPDEKEGLRKLEASAAQGLAAARYELAYRYLCGKGRRQSSEGKKLLRQAASSGDYRAQYLSRVLQGNRGCPDRARVASAVSRAAKKNPAAAATLAFMYLIGEGVMKSVREEVHWYHSAAAAGDPRAAVVLGLMYYHGESVERREDEAARLMKRGAQAGDPAAQYFLGTFYHDGRGVKADRGRAAAWLKKSARQGFPQARYAYGMMLLSGDGVAADRAAAVENLSMAARSVPRAREVLAELTRIRPVTREEAEWRNDLPALAQEKERQAPLRLEGRGLVLDRGDFSLKFSLPDVSDIAADGGSIEKRIWSRLQGGGVEIIFHDR